jgi:hypothetical protein
MKYLKTKEGSLEEAISKAINEKPDSSNELKEARYEIQFSPGDFDEMSADDFADQIQNDLKNDYRIRAKVLNTGRKEMGLTFDTNVPRAKMLKILEDEMGYIVEGYDVNAKELEEAGGKYLKYSDLLLQKGRLIQQGKPTAMIDREISKEMKKLGIKEATGDKEKYTKFFNAALKKFGVKSPADFKDDAKKKEFFNYVDKNYKGDHEESNNLEEVNAKYITDKDQGNRDLQKLIKKHKLKIKTLQKNVNPGYDEVEISGDKREMEKFLKTTGDMDNLDLKFNPRTKEFEEELDKEDKPTVQKVVKMLKKASKAHADQSKSLEKDLQDDVDKTIDTIQQANDSKRQSMRSILADIWKMNEGKSPFEKDEGFASDAQRRAAFASGYKAKGKKGKKEEIEKSDKTMTGKKPTKVEIEPQVK